MYIETCFERFLCLVLSQSSAALADEDISGVISNRLAYFVACPVFTSANLEYISIENIILF